MIGQTLGHYKILDKLGEGGMGEVYLAADTTLKRKVALKVLPPDLASSQDRLERFQREAEALAALDHPNIVTIHTVEEAEGTRFLTMQLVDGKPLSELIPPNGMALEQIFTIATPMADALASAHDKGIIHRDLKPANVMVTTEGRVKVLDFGLAKLSHDPSLVSTQLATEPLTQDGLILGTMPYMSPEQLQGKELDGRSDVFSLGVMLYEMATGERPFKGDTSATLIMSIGRDTAPEVDSVRGELPHHLGRVIGRCLEKDPDERFQTIKDVRNEFAALKRETDSSVTSASRIDVPQVEPRKRVWWVAVVVAGLVVAALGSWLLVREPEPGAQTSDVVEDEDVAETQAASTDATEAATGSDRKMIVVLPFENLGSPEDDYFAAGMTEEITSRLAMVSEMGVISRKSAVRYADTDKSMQEIGAELGVDYVLEGTVRWAKNGDSSRVRITPQLIQVSDDTHLWADTYDRVIADVFALQSEIAESVITELGISLLDTERQSLAVKPTDNPAAYQAYLQGLESFYRPSDFSLEEIRRGAKMFERAVALDPTFARAWAWLSRMKVMDHFNGGIEPGLVAGAKAALDRATELAPEDPHVRLASGYYHYHGLGDYDRALQEFEAIAAELPNDAEVLFAMGAILRAQGRFEESVAAKERYLLLDPQSTGVLFNIANTYRAQRRFDEAIRSLDRAIGLTPNNASLYGFKAYVLMDVGRLDAARKVLRQAPVAEPMHEEWFWQEYVERNFEAALEHAETMPRDEPLAGLTANYNRTLALFSLDRTEEAREILQEAAGEAETLFDSGSDLDSGAMLAYCYALLDRKEDAIRTAKKLIERRADDVRVGPIAEEVLAWVYTAVGDPEAAIEIFDRLLTIPYHWAITVEALRLDPRADPIRDDPRFQAMLEKHGQETGESG